MYILCYIYIYTAPSGLMYSVAPTIQRSSLVGTNLITLHYNGAPFAVDFDYRYLAKYYSYKAVKILLISAGITIFSGLISMLLGSGELNWMVQIQ